MPRPASSSGIGPPLYSCPELRIEWDPSLEALLCTWNGFLGTEEYRRLCLCSLEPLRQLSARRLIADARELRARPLEDECWSSQYWMPRAVEAGLRQMAVVVPRAVFAQIAVSRVVHELNHGALALAQFESVGEARAWLEVT